MILTDFLHPTGNDVAAAEVTFLPRVALVAGVRFGATLRMKDFEDQVDFMQGVLETHLGAGDHLYVGTSFGTDFIVAAAHSRLSAGGRTPVPKLYVVAPFAKYDATWSEFWKDLYASATQGAEFVFAGDDYTAGAYTRRDQDALRLADAQAEQLNAERMMLTLWSGERGTLSESILEAHAHGFTVKPLMDDLNERLRRERYKRGYDA